MDILLICNFWHFEFEKQSSRYRTMADVLSSNPDFELEVVSSSFRHQTKQQRDLEYTKSIPADYKVTLLHEPGYKKNISLKRIYSHHCFAKEVVKYLKTRKKPDIIICSVPSLSVGSAVTKYANRNGIKVIVDIQDLWPEAFKMAINIPVVSDVLFSPMMLQANAIYKRADKIMAVSDTYVQRGLSKNSKDSNGVSLFIGTDSELVNREISEKTVEKNENEFWVGYAGALGHSYDIPLIIDAISLLNKKGNSNIVFKIMGEGVLSDEFKKYAAEKNVNCDFMGFLSYGDMMANLMACDVAVNPIAGRSAASIINKVSDYAMAGVPVVNTHNSKEYRELLEKYECGINCENGNPQSVAEAIEKLYDIALKERMGCNAKRMAEECFDRQKTYPKIISVINEMSAKI
ncbi:MAG: glycosyltransferase family 4 protein [Acutalibacteraceae bacterium]